jgi:hypothetical protein
MKALSEDLPVLFAKIGWAVSYDGSEDVEGGSSWVEGHPRENGESSSFRANRGVFRGFAGHGAVPERFHIVFVARNPLTKELCVVGFYADARRDSEPSLQRTKHAVLVRHDKRPPLTTEWRGRLRLWAKRDRGTTHAGLLREFRKLARQLPALSRHSKRNNTHFDQTYDGIEALEGKEYQRYVKSRQREARLSKRKKAQVLSKHGKLVCEVPRCGFDFSKTYGVMYAHVHHLNPLSKRAQGGENTSLDDLAIVCANCHAMIHYRGQCQDLGDLIPR